MVFVGRFAAKLLDIASIALHDRFCRLCGLGRIESYPARTVTTHQTAPHVKTAAGGFGVVLRAIGAARLGWRGLYRDYGWVTLQAAEKFAFDF